MGHRSDSAGGRAAAAAQAAAILAMLGVLPACSSGSPPPAAAPVAAAAPWLDAGVGLASGAVVDAAPAIDAPPPPPPVADRIELTFMGDVMFGGRFSGKWFPRDVPKHDPLARVAHLLASDLALANLETTVMSEIPELQGDLRFVATPDQVATLPANGLMAVTLANNHINDVDAAGVAETPGHLAALGMTVIGGPRPDDPLYRVETVDVRGWKIGFVAATTKLNRTQKKKDKPPTIPFVDPDKLQDALVPVITAARADHDLVIVVLHWGVQYDDVPSSWQVEAAHAFVDAGASVVVGHHPHVLQGIERYGDGVIAYSLGNFVFQNANPGRRNTGVLRLGFARHARCLDKLMFHPAIIRKAEVHYPEPPRPREVDDVGDRIIGLSGSKKMKTTWRLDGDSFVAEPVCPPAPAPAP